MAQGPSFRQSPGPELEPCLPLLRCVALARLVPSSGNRDMVVAAPFLVGPGGLQQDQVFERVLCGSAVPVGPSAGETGLRAPLPAGILAAGRSAVSFSPP